MFEVEVHVAQVASLDMSKYLQNHRIILSFEQEKINFVSYAVLQISYQNHGLTF